MLLKINQIKCPVETPFDAACIARKLHASERDILQYEIERESLDAREDTLFYSYTVLAEVRNGQRYLKRKDVQEGHRKTYTPPSPLTSEERPLVVGFGPSGMFSALLLAECGLKPIVIERGKPVEQRSLDIEKFFTEGILCCESNVQFGEGGAGTFSDGKLTTRMKDIRVKKVLEEFIEAGADPAIAYQHRPHIGTDVLQVLVRNIRNKILSLGITIILAIVTDFN